MTFSIGQTVEVSDPNGLDGFKYGGYMYLDRGTVIHTIGKSLVKLNMHKTRLHYSNTLYAWADCLRLYVPLDAPGRNKRSYETMQALNIVLLEETPPAMKEVIRELEHTRQIIIKQSATLVQIKDTVKDRFNGYVCDHECIGQIRESLDELDV